LKEVESNKSSVKEEAIKDKMMKNKDIKEVKQDLSDLTPIEDKLEQSDIEEVQRLVEEYKNRIKQALIKTNKKIEDYINEYVMIGEIEKTEYEIVPVTKLMEAVNKICPNEFTEDELNNVKEIFNQLGNTEYVLVEDLLKFFDENWDNKNEEIVEDNKVWQSIAELDEISTQIIKELNKHLHENQIQLNNFLNEHTYKTGVKVDEKESELDVIKPKDFFSLLRKANLLPYEEGDDIYKNLNEFLCVEEDIISINKIQEAIKFFENNSMTKIKENHNELDEHKISVEDKEVDKTPLSDAVKQIDVSKEVGEEKCKDEDILDELIGSTLNQQVNSPLTEQNEVKNENKEESKNENKHEDESKIEDNGKEELNGETVKVEGDKGEENNEEKKEANNELEVKKEEYNNKEFNKVEEVNSHIVQEEDKHEVQSSNRQEYKDDFGSENDEALQSPSEP